MNNKKIIIVILITIITLLIIGLFKSNVYAADSADDIMSKADNWVQGGENNQKGTINEKDLKDGINILYDVFVGIGILLVTVIGMLLGIKIMMASSADEKSEYKKQIKTYVVGVVVIFGAYIIWKFAINIIQGFS